MEQRRHTKLLMKKKTQVMRGENLNPSAATSPALRRKVMRGQPS
jgi:DNA (cytosine-5)-methyltransferase 1